MARPTIGVKASRGSALSVSAAALFRERRAPTRGARRRIAAATRVLAALARRARLWRAPIPSRPSEETSHDRRHRSRALDDHRLRARRPSPREHRRRGARSLAVGTRSRWLVDKSEAVGRSAMVTAMHPLAADVGAQILERGGSAIDAAVATAFAVGVVEPFMSGVGGIAFLVYRDSASGRTVCFDGSSVLPAAIRPEMFELLGPDERSGMY